MYKQGCYSDMHIFPTSIDFLSLASEPCFKKGLLPKVCKIIFLIVFVIFCGPPISRSYMGAEKFSHWVGDRGGLILMALEIKTGQREV